jgi:hypothetical protein
MCYTAANKVGRAPKDMVICGFARLKALSQSELTSSEALLQVLLTLRRICQSYTLSNLCGLNHQHRSISDRHTDRQCLLS